MHIITVINAKGGCGKSTIAMGLASGLARRGHPTLLIDMDPQAQITQWLGLGDGLSPQGTLVAAMEGRQSLEEIIQQTSFQNLSFIASSQQLEDLGRQITDSGELRDGLYRAAGIPDEADRVRRHRLAQPDLPGDGERDLPL
jgi:chromosome partitioning protein